MERRGEPNVPGLGQGAAQELAFRPGTTVSMDPDAHVLQGVVTDMRRDDAGQLLVYVLPWRGEAKPYRPEELTPVEGRVASTIDRFIGAALARRLPCTG